MTPALLARMRAATDTIVARYGRPLKSPVTVAVDPANRFTVAPSPPLIIEQGQVRIGMTATAGNGSTFPTWVCALSADALAWCDAVDAAVAGSADVAGLELHHNSSVLLYGKSGGVNQLSVGVGPGYQGDASGNLSYGTIVWGAVAVQPAALSALTTAIRSMVQ